MSRHHDGEAVVWTVGEKLCFGGKTFKAPGLFSTKEVPVDSADVLIYGIEVLKEEGAVFWSTFEQQDKSGKRSGISLKSSTCIEYSKAPDGFSVKSPARPLEEGLYSINLYGNDKKTNKRAAFFGHFCLKTAAGLRVQAAAFDEKNSRWGCAP